MTNRLLRIVPALLPVLLLTSACERPPVDTVQRGYRGTQMGLVYNPRTVEAQGQLHQPPPALKPVKQGLVLGRAGDIYKSVEVLGDVDIAEFGRTMIAMTQWVAPEDGGCLYCHSEGNLADDSKYTKRVARQMLKMTRAINSQWTTHVAQTGVTCFTCHRGRPQPIEFWHDAVPQPRLFMGDRAGQNEPSVTVGFSSLPNDPLGAFLVGNESIRVIGTTDLPTGNRQSIKQAEWTYGLMMHMSSALGVNCTFCHNTRSFADWDTSPPQRAVAWWGIRMVRNMNQNVFLPLKDTWPPNRLGDMGDPPKLNCATCHRGAYKPLHGAPVAKDYPALYDDPAQAAAAAAAAASMAASPTAPAGAVSN